MDCWRQLAVMIFASACALFAAAPMEARAQESTSASQNGETCPAGGASFTDALHTPHWNGWGVDATQRRFQPADMAGLSAEDVPRLKLKWAFGFPGATRAFAQPTIFGGRLFVGSEGGGVYSLDASSGCTYWQFDADAGVRSAVSIGPRADSFAIYFGDFRANVYAVDAADRQAVVADKGRGPSRRAHHRRAHAGRDDFVRARLFVRRSSPGRAPPIGAARSAAASSRWRPRPERLCGRATRSRRSLSQAP